MIVSTLSLRRVYIALLKLFAVLQRVQRYTDVHDCDVACNGSIIGFTKSKLKTYLPSLVQPPPLPLYGYSSTLLLPVGPG